MISPLILLLSSSLSSSSVLLLWSSVSVLVSVSWVDCLALLPLQQQQPRLHPQQPQLLLHQHNQQQFLLLRSSRSRSLGRRRLDGRRRHYHHLTATAAADITSSTTTRTTTDKDDENAVVDIVPVVEIVDVRKNPNNHVVPVVEVETEEEDDDDDCWETSITTTSSASGTPEELQYAEELEEFAEELEQEDLTRDRQDQMFIVMAIVPSLLAFFAWEDISHTLAVFLDSYGAIGRNVDGGQFTVTLLRPTITGVVVPVISIALATLVSTTINVLRERQVFLRQSINKEACELRLLRRAIFGMFGTRQHATRRAKALALMAGYVEQLEKECEEGAVETLEELQLSGGIAVNELEMLSEMLHGVDGAAASRQGSVGVADNLILSLNGHRSDRVALLLSVFPVIHWGVLIALSFSLLFTFLLNSNQQVLQYLNSVQLRMLFAILVGVFSGTATLCINLADPFRGSFSVAEAAAQLGDLRLCLKQDVLEATAEEGEITSKVVHALLLGGRNYNDLSESDPVSKVQVSKELTEELARNGQIRSNGSKDGQAAIGVERTRNTNTNNNDRTRRRYGLASTVYFHLLTGPLGSNARVLGDVIAWLASYVGSWTRAASNRMKKVLWFRTRPGSRSRSRSRPAAQA